MNFKIWLNESQYVEGENRKWPLSTRVVISNFTAEIIHELKKLNLEGTITFFIEYQPELTDDKSMEYFVEADKESKDKIERKIRQLHFIEKYGWDPHSK